MAQWGTKDQANNSPLWGPAKYNLAPNTSNRANLYDNATANAFEHNQTVGVFGADINEVQANRKIAHTGWVVRTVGTGGRAGRTQYEVLVAGGISTDGADDAYFPDVSVSFLAQPRGASGSVANNAIVNFPVTAASAPAGATIVYQWQYNATPANNAAWANATTGFSNTTTATLSALANTAANGSVRVVIGATGAANVTSNAATFTTTA